MAFVTSNRYPDWYGHLLVGSLENFNIWEIKRKSLGDKNYFDVGRLQCSTGPDGYIYRWKKEFLKSFQLVC
jgi:hypothetical protein